MQERKGGAQVVEEVGRKGVWQERWARVERSEEKGVVKEITGLYMEKGRDFGRIGGEGLKIGES